jgi:hypothetical protein
MSSIAYPQAVKLVDAGMMAAAFTALAGKLYRCNTLAGSFNVSLPVVGSGATATAALTAGAVTSATVVLGGADYSEFAVIIASGGTPVVPATFAPVFTAGVLTGVTIVTPGSGYVTAPTLTIVPGAKVGDEVFLADGKFNFGNNPLVVKTGANGHRLAGQVAGVDLDVDAPGQSVQLRCVTAEGWTVVG